MGNTLTQSGEAIEIYTPCDITSSGLRKRQVHFLSTLEGKKFILRAGLELKYPNYESVQRRVQFSGIKKGAKISFHRHFKNPTGLKKLNEGKIAES